MLAVAVVALTMGSAVGLWRRRERFRRIASEHEPYCLDFPCFGDWRLYEWHWEMKTKYEQAAARPWEPVPPDPPVPPSIFDRGEAGAEAVP